MDMKDAEKIIQEEQDNVSFLFEDPMESFKRIMNFKNTIVEIEGKKFVMRILKDQ